MCGVCGQFNFRNGEPAEPETLRRMADSITHRGPDDEGFYFDGPLGLGFRRLSIIDLGGGHQPMSDEERSVWVVFNGEIYNFPELKRELETYGHRFRTQSDTEVIVHGYKQWGLDVFNHLNGMFGLAIWDVRRKRLVVVRDAFGIKVVYYRLEKNRLVFGSEIRAIQAGDNESPEVDPVSLNLFLRYRFTPSPSTIYRGINKLAPGTMLIAEAGTVKVERWYKFKPEPFSPMLSDEEAREELLAIYRRALKRHLLSDVPVGLLLSGGLDSGLLLGLMNENDSQWPTFSIGYGTSFRDDELVDAAETASTFKARHTSIEIDRTLFESSLPKIVSCLEEPIAASSVVPMYFLCQRARQDVKVALSGQGPDELFGGYPRHLGVRYGRLWSSFPSWSRSAVGSVIQRLPRADVLRRGLYSLDTEDRLQRYQNVLSIAPAATVDGLFHAGLLPQDAGDRILESWSGLVPLMKHTDELGGMQFIEIRSTLPDELLMYSDKLSMAHSLEVRVPYLDREVVEFAERLNANFKVRRGASKWLHRSVCRNYLPKHFLRRKKRGFADTVLDDWFRQAFKGGFEQTLNDPSSEIYNLLNPKTVRQLLVSHQTGERDNHKILFSLLVCETLLRRSTLAVPTSA
jgi:asparagine synthase (glutamine-hydrolysing)